MTIRCTIALLLAVLMFTATACARHNDSDTAVPGGNTAGTGTAPTPPPVGTGTAPTPPPASTSAGSH